VSAVRQPPSIDALGAGGFRVAGVWLPGSLLILGDAPGPWRPQALDEVGPDDFAAVIDGGAAVSEFVLLGTGVRQAPPPRAVRVALERAGLGLEFMSTQNAARTYGLLISDGRRPAVALIAV
jgi:uncharacterized protein